MLFSRLNLIVPSLLVYVICVSSATPQALSIPPSEQWAGDDGHWSTFYVQIGTPGQTIQLLAGTSASAGTTIWPVIPLGCVDASGNGQNVDLAGCSDLRGGLFNSNKSTTWSTQGLPNGNNGVIFNLTTVVESQLNLSGLEGSFGFDTVSLGIPGQGLPAMSNQLISGISSNDYFIGSLGLSPWPTNLTDFNHPIPSLLASMRNQSLIPSKSWGYTAGSYDRSVFASLTLGGYDTSRFEPNNLSMAFGSDISRDLLVRLQSITYDTAGSSPLLTNAFGIDVFIDSMVTELWLPTSVCESFAQQFQLTWDSSSGYYFINASSHQALFNQNPTFVFTIAHSGGGGQTVAIEIPYAAFDLTLTAPITGANATRRYFPVRRAYDQSQYVLGRAFLQAAYVIADYDRGNFSVSQALYPSSSVAQNIVAIEATGANAQKQSLTPGQIAAIVVVCGLGLIIAVAFALRFWLKWRKRDTPTPVDVKYSQVEIDESKEGSNAYEVQDETPRWEADGRPLHPELPVHADGMYELEQPNYVHELWTRDHK